MTLESEDRGREFLCGDCLAAIAADPQPTEGAAAASPDDYCPVCGGPPPQAVVCGVCGSRVCGRCGTPLEAADELGAG